MHGRNYNRRPWGPYNPQHQVRELNYSLEQQHTNYCREQKTRLQLSKELDETKEQLAHQKTLKEMYINREKATRDELERLKRASDPETMIIMRIATEVRSTIKTKENEVLQNNYEDLKVAYIISQQKFAVEIQFEKDQNKALQQELEQLKVAHPSNLSDKDELKDDGKNRGMSEDLEVTKRLMAEKDILIDLKEEEVQTLEEKLDKQASTNQELIIKLQAEQQVSQGLRMKLTQLREEHQDKTREQQCANNCCKELDETKQKLARQKILKEMFINREKATRDELERLKRASDPDTMITMRIATEVRSTIKTKEKKVLQNEYEDLKVAHIISQQKLQVEKDQNKALQQELEKLRVAHPSNLSNKDELKDDGKKMRMSEDLEVTKQLMAVKDTLLHQMKEEIQTLQKNASEKEKAVFKELEDLKHKQASTHLELVTKLQAEEEVSQGLRTQLTQLKEEQQDKTREQQKEKEALKQQMEKLKVQLQSAETLSGCQEKKVKELTTKLERQNIPTKSLQKQVEENKLRIEEIKILQKSASERKKSFLNELECLKKRLKKQASTHQELVIKLQAEEKVSQGLRTQLTQLKEEQQDKIRQQEKEALEKMEELKAANC